MSKAWSHGAFNCCEDIGTCCMASCCPCILSYSNGEELGESGVLCFLLGCIVPCIPIMLLRTKARETYDIEGSTADDAVMSFCCGCCAQIQTTNEIKQNKG
eukprot:GFUD01015696.1.p1 GENE.GFUD01015696.1~~GFUD01015696.1.p1  ORF type:complete len:101 (-),score=23.03 GFUD01015696.1:48-350(-)